MIKSLEKIKIEKIEEIFCNQILKLYSEKITAIISYIMTSFIFINNIKHLIRFNHY